MTKKYTAKYFDLTHDEDYNDDFVGRVDIEKPHKQLLTDDEIVRLEDCFEHLPVSITANETGMSLWLFDTNHVREILSTVQEELSKQ